MLGGLHPRRLGAVLAGWMAGFGQAARAAYQHQCTDAAAAMAFDFVFAVFPCVLALTALLGLLDIRPEAFRSTLESLGIVVPAPVLRIVEENIERLWASAQGLFLVGLLGVLWPASASMTTTMTALNRAFGFKEERSFWRRRVLSILLVMAFGVSVVVLFNLIVFGEQVDAWLSAHWDFFGHSPSVAGLLRRASGVVGTIAVVASVYRWVPAVRLRWADVMPGSLFFFMVWYLITRGFRYYALHFGYYNIVFGVLGAVIVTLLTAYLVALVLLFGGELNAALFRRRHSVAGPRPLSRPPVRQRGGPSARSGARHRSPH
ncbi:MAG: YihY/virulence factor BrkB family protein [Candidatus Latescibacterota bacterium]